MLPMAIVCILAAGAQAATAPAYRAEIEAWREKREARLRAPHGWLAVSGLYWLQPGPNILPPPYEQAGVFELKDEKVVIRKGKQMGEAPVKVESADTKYSSTTVRYSNGDGKYHIQEIHLGGTNMKLIVNVE